MKDFLKITLAVIVGCLIVGIVKLFVFFGLIDCHCSEIPSL